MWKESKSARGIRGKGTHRSPELVLRRHDHHVASAIAVSPFLRNRQTLGNSPCVHERENGRTQFRMAAQRNTP